MTCPGSIKVARYSQKIPSFMGNFFLANAYPAIVAVTTLKKQAQNTTIKLFFTYVRTGKLDSRFLKFLKSMDEKSKEADMILFCVNDVNIMNINGYRLIATSISRIRPVSYTHLDVYKRQK